MRGAGCCLLALAIVLGDAGGGDASEVPRVGAHEIGLQAGYSFGITNNAQMISFFPRLTRVVAVTEGPRPGALTFGLEGMFSRVFETSHAMELGGGLLLRYRLLVPAAQPYVEVGGAMLYSDLRRFNLNSRILFAAQGAVGLQIPLHAGLAATAGYRFRHISNAGQDRDNPGLNSNLLVAGISYLY